MYETESGLANDTALPLCWWLPAGCGERERDCTGDRIIGWFPVVSHIDARTVPSDVWSSLSPSRPREGIREGLMSDKPALFYWPPPVRPLPCRLGDTEDNDIEDGSVIDPLYIREFHYSTFQGIITSQIFQRLDTQGASWSQTIKNWRGDLHRNQFIIIILTRSWKATTLTMRFMWRSLCDIIDTGNTWISLIFTLISLPLD